MEVLKRTEKVGRSNSIPIAEIKFDYASIYVLEGSKGKKPELDLFIKYSDCKNKKSELKFVAPKHVHWAMDFVIKKEHNSGKLYKFVKILIKKYLQFEKNNPLTERNFKQIKSLIDNNIFEKRDKFISLDRYGRYKTEFIYYLLILIAVNELNSADNPYMFIKTLKTIVDKEKDFTEVIDIATGGNW